MSQEKVDQHKKEKKNREKDKKKARRKKVIAIFVIAAIVGCIIGYPLGKYLYKQHDKKQKENAVVELANFDYWFSNYWSKTHEFKFETDDYGEEDNVDDYYDESYGEMDDTFYDETYEEYDNSFYDESYGEYEEGASTY